MQESLLHYLWKFRKFKNHNISTASGESIEILNHGTENTNAGPDFVNAQLKIDTQHWAGNVEIHLKSSDWYVHGHEVDANYDNVILHVVWEHDIEIFQHRNHAIPTLILANYVDTTFLANYHHFMTNAAQFIKCEKSINEVSHFSFNNWVERLYIERLNDKYQTIEAALLRTKNNWEAVLFEQLCKYFGSKVNAAYFYQLAKSFNFHVIQKLQSHQLDIEALFFGQANLLNEARSNTYYVELKKRYQFLKSKYALVPFSPNQPSFFRLRPNNFPTIRLAQLAMLYHKKKSLFERIIEASDLPGLYELFDIETSKFWCTHYTFTKESKPRAKKMTKPFIDILIINTIIPVKYAYQRHTGNTRSDELLELMAQIKLEKNSIVQKFLSLRDMPKSALYSQGILQLKSTYCDKNRCLQCAIGNHLLSN